MSVHQGNGHASALGPGRTRVVIEGVAALVGLAALSATLFGTADLGGRPARADARGLTQIRWTFGSLGLDTPVATSQARSRGLLDHHQRIR